MNVQAIQQFLDDPAHEWEGKSIGIFRRYVWPRLEPPRWQTGTAALRESSSRAFVGMGTPRDAQHVDRALATLELAMNHWLTPLTAGPTTLVVLWDRMFPMPEEWELPPLPEPPCPLTVLSEAADVSILILLPTYDIGRFGGRDRAWLESSAIHEAFHALLNRFFGRDAVFAAHRYGWAKFEEMCAVALEACLLRHGKAWMDYGYTWRVTLSLSHDRYSWSAFFDSADGDFTRTVDSEDYGHFALLSFLNEEVWPERARPRHWLAAVWEAVNDDRVKDGPWAVLDDELAAEGGVTALFLRYVREAAFPARTSGVLAELHKMFGPPAAARLIRGAAKKFFAIGPMSAQLFEGRVERKSGGGFLRIIDYKNLNDTVVELFRMSGKTRMREGTPQEIPRPWNSGNSRIWEIPVPAPSSRHEDFLLLVSQPNYQGRSLAFTTEWV